MFASRLVLISLSLLIAQSASAITIDTVPIGNAGNANDPATGNLYGGVAYDYRIGKYDVTVGQYTAFLNAVAATDTYSLYKTQMATDLSVAGISQSGSSGSYSYSVIGSANHPITYVRWEDAARFANWLSNGQPGLGGSAVPQDASSTEDGAYTLNGVVDGGAVTRNAALSGSSPRKASGTKRLITKTTASQTIIGNIQLERTRSPLPHPRQHSEHGEYLQ